MEAGVEDKGVGIEVAASGKREATGGWVEVILCGWTEADDDRLEVRASG